MAWRAKANIIILRQEYVYNRLDKNQYAFESSMLMYIELVSKDKITCYQNYMLSVSVSWQSYRSYNQLQLYSYSWLAAAAVAVARLATITVIVAVQSPSTTIAVVVSSRPLKVCVCNKRQLRLRPLYALICYNLQLQYVRTSRATSANVYNIFLYIPSIANCQLLANYECIKYTSTNNL